MKTLLAALALSLVACASTATGEDGDEPSYLFVQTSASATLENGRLTLEGVSPSMLWFADRPERMAGHCHVDKFLEAMTGNTDADNFGEDPPNATLSVFSEDSVTDVVVTLMDPKLVGDTLTYTVKHLEGPESVRGGPASLFIDPIHQPSSTEKVVVRRGPRHPVVVHPVVRRHHRR